ncbi:MAG: FGGY-family carbohydrate kinase, partial [Phycisphaerae bacterium]
VMQIYADIIGRPIAISRSSQTCALGSAVAAAVVAGKAAGGYADFGQAVKKMTGIQKKVFKPNPKAVKVYQRLYELYMQLHDSFGIQGHKADISNVMKDLLTLRDVARKG